MSVTVSNIMQSFNVDRSAVRQIDNKQLFIVDLPTGRVLVSYKTIVGKFIAGEWLLTKERYSVTTTKQLNQFARHSPFTCKFVDNI